MLKSSKFRGNYDYIDEIVLPLIFIFNFYTSLGPISDKLPELYIILTILLILLSAESSEISYFCLYKNGVFTVVFAEHGGNYFNCDGRMINITQGSYKNLKCVIFKNEGGNMSSS